jgi:uncharacterized membrane protein (DUF106 family)
MGLLDLPAPLLSAVDAALAGVLPPLIRLLLWGVAAGWLTMLVYRRLSNQEKIGLLKAEQKAQQKRIAEFDGEFSELMPLVRATLGTGFRQLGLALGPALLATVPVLFLVVWVASAFAYQAPEPGAPVRFTAEPAASGIHWEPPAAAQPAESGWLVTWPAPDSTVVMTDGESPLLRLPLEHDVPVIHTRKWWNWFMANPLGYLPEGGNVETIHIALPERSYLAFGPQWMRGWMFSFFLTFLLSSVAFKFLLRID